MLMMSGVRNVATMRPDEAMTPLRRLFSRFGWRTLACRLCSAGVATVLAEATFAATATQGVIATGGGRAGALVAVVFALAGAVTGGVALARSARAMGSGGGRDGAIVALVLGLVGTGLGGLHLVTSTGAIGSGNGRAGAIAAVLLGLVGMAVAGLALGRARRAG
jgi:hypothetical protein